MGASVLELVSDIETAACTLFGFVEVSATQSVDQTSKFPLINVHNSDMEKLVATRKSIIVGLDQPIVENIKIILT